RVEAEGRRRVDVADVGKIRAEVVVAQRRVDLFDDLAAPPGEPCLELLERPAAAREVRRAEHDFLGDVVVHPFAHRRMQGIGVDRAPEEVRQAGERQVYQARARTKHEGPALAQVLHGRHGDVAGLDTRDDVAVVALHQLAQFLQANLRIDLVVFAYDFDLASGNGVADFVEVQVHAAYVGITQRRKHFRIGVQRADLQWLPRLRQHCRRHAAEQTGRAHRAYPFYKPPPCQA